MTFEESKERNYKDVWKMLKDLSDEALNCQAEILTLKRVIRADQIAISELYSQLMALKKNDKPITPI